MVDDVVLNKSATIERCVARAREEYFRDPESFSTDFTRQDSSILNIQRACEALLDLGAHLIKVHKLGLPQSSRDILKLLADNKWITPELSATLKKMISFRNIAVHDYQELHIPIVIAVITKHLDDFLAFKKAIILRSSATK